MNQSQATPSKSNIKVVAPTTPLNRRQRRAALARLDGSMPAQERAALLSQALQSMVPLAAMDLARVPHEKLVEQAGRDRELLQQEVDALLRGQHRKGEVQRVLSALARTVAIGAFAPGGVEVLGQRYRWQRQAAPVPPVGT